METFLVTSGLINLGLFFIIAGLSIKTREQTRRIKILQGIITEAVETKRHNNINTIKYLVKKNT